MKIHLQIFPCLRLNEVFYYHMSLWICLWSELRCTAEDVFGSLLHSAKQPFLRLPTVRSDMTKEWRSNCSDTSDTYTLGIPNDSHHARDSLLKWKDPHPTLAAVHCKLSQKRVQEKDRTASRNPTELAQVQWNVNLIVSLIFQRKQAVAVIYWYATQSRYRNRMSCIKRWLGRVICHRWLVFSFFVFMYIILQL